MVNGVQHVRFPFPIFAYKAIDLLIHLKIGAFEAFVIDKAERFEMHEKLGIYLIVWKLCLFRFRESELARPTLLLQQI
ncbi:hypothetical protein NMS_1914 [Nonlabens marinus S1-08]|uniref:Uncharacterized protein n=1 Tax=Nonlabens marinus S1-08 TaxID=1454201 RepID=W8VW11_9FLAO|nr:hypothetical protein NMS_1914 [Nonlabens marinus S1-08]